MSAEEVVQITVDGQPVEARASARLLDVLRDLGIRIPTLCHDQRLAPYGGCRLCVVTRRDGRRGLIPACSTPVLPGMIIETRTPEVVEARRRQLQLLALNHRLECPACDRRGDCRFQDLLYEYGVPERRLPFDRVRLPRDEASPVIVRDPEKCILCGKCVRLCDEVQGVAAIGLVHRGLNTRVATLLDRPLDCEFCGQCVNACPVGALVARPYSSDVASWLRTKGVTTCSFCSCGCQVSVDTCDGTLVSVGSDTGSEPNHGKLCVKGWLGLDALTSDDRLQRPLVRRDGRLVETSWEEALAAAAAALEEARAAGGRVVAVGGSRLASEDAYLMQRLFRAAATPHVGLGPAGGVAALADGMAALTDAPRSSATLDDLREADVVFVLRADPTRTHPLVKTELVQGVKQRGQKLALAHALSGGLERHAALYLPLAPCGEEPLLHALAAALLSSEPQARTAWRAVDGFDAWQAAIESHTPEALSAGAGVPAALLERLSALLRGARKVVTVVTTGLGIPGDEAGVTRAAVVLDALLGPRGGGVLVLGEKANLQGTFDVGLHPRWLPGGRRADDAGARAVVESLWGTAVPDPEAIPITAAAHGAAGAVDVLYLAGQDPVGAWPRELRGTEAVERARFVIVQDAFLSATARLANVVLPVSILAEREGTMIGADGVRRILRPVIAAPAGLPQDGDIFRELGRRLGLLLPDVDALERELEALAAWPLPRPAIRRFVPPGGPVGRPRGLGMLLDASPQLFRSGSTTEHSRLLQQLSPSVAVRVSPRDAPLLGVGNGDPVRLTSPAGEVLLRARVDRTVRPGTVVAEWRARHENAAALLIRDAEPTLVQVRRSS